MTDRVEVTWLRGVESKTLWAGLVPSRVGH